MSDLYKLQRFLVFWGRKFYPYGGFNDFILSFDSLDEARKYIEENRAKWDWAQIVDSEDFRKTEITYKE